MLDGRVLGASQVEYKPFGKRPLKREIGGTNVTNARFLGQRGESSSRGPRHLPGIGA